MRLAGRGIECAESYVGGGGLSSVAADDGCASWARWTDLGVGVSFAVVLFG